MKLHSDYKPFTCDYEGCSFTSNDSANMSKHKKIHFPPTVGCVYGCGKMTKRRDGIKRHYKSCKLRKAYLHSAQEMAIVAMTGSGIMLPKDFKAIACNVALQHCMHQESSKLGKILPFPKQKHLDQMRMQADSPAGQVAVEAHAQERTIVSNSL